ncbi:sigma factor-like helix-turn-helix DNA-binding protein [Luteococcus sp. OSA5]|uniref:sigma factor-like helix-turn-helix DNA-binding protein n=1 Tax=Luteococcus sp. OSA5 TaxID=3401630 RepID=UPI003B43D36F
MKPQTTTAISEQACVELATVFQHPLLEDGQTPANARERHLQTRLMHQAEQACGSCPLLQRCLYNAVVEHDVAGYCAGTTASQRNAIRARLGLRVKPEDLDSFAGVVTPNRQIDPHEVLRLRAANPHDSLETIAQRLGCSLSTVKRHLRKARTSQIQPRALRQVRPSMEQVLLVARQVLRREPASRDQAA